MIRIVALLLLTSVFFFGCGSDIIDQVNEAIDIADGVPERSLDRRSLSVNAFFNDGRFGGFAEQFNEITVTLGIPRIRVLFAWDDNVQPSPASPPNFSFYDDIIEAAPPSSDILIVLTNTPSWMSNPANWIANNPRRTFVEQWVSRIVRRYGTRNNVVGFQIWNEPNQQGRRDNSALALDDNPENYLELLSLAYDSCKERAPLKLVVSGATTAINQNFPESLNYNRRLRDGGIASFIDVYGVHYYGRQFENVVRSGGVADFLSSVPKRVWVTESGAQGVSDQKKYARQVWPFLKEKIPSIERFYYYQMYENTAPNVTYGLKNLTTGSALSDLYIYLRDEI
jgi:hypothetical protein